MKTRTIALAVSAAMAFAAASACAAPSVKFSWNTFNVQEGVTDAIVSQIQQDLPKADVNRVAISARKINNADLAKLVELVPNAKEVSIYDSRALTDLSPLAKLKEVRSVTVRGTIASDFSPLSGLTTVERLNIDSEQMTSMAWAKNLTGLKYLSINAKALGSWEGLPSIPTLARATLTGAPAPLDPIVAALPGLKDLELRYATISDLTPLTKLAKLEDLNLYGAQVADFSPLAGCASLRKLNYYATKGANYATLGKLTQIVELHGGLTDLKDISWIQTLPYLRKFDVFAEYVTDYSPLAKTQVEDMQIWSMREPVDLTSLGGVTSLKRLKLWSVERASNSKVLAGLTKLEHMIISGYNQRGGDPFDLSAAAGWTNVRKLEIGDVKVINSESVAQCKAVEQLSLSKVQGFDLAVIKSLPALRNLSFYKMDVTDEAVKALGLAPTVRVNIRK